MWNSWVNPGRLCHATTQRIHMGEFYCRALANVRSRRLSLPTNHNIHNRHPTKVRACWSIKVVWIARIAIHMSVFRSSRHRSKVFNSGDTSRSEKIFDFGRGHNTILMLPWKKTKHFCNAKVSLFRKSSSVWVCHFVVLLSFIYFLLNWPEYNDEKWLVCLEPRQEDMGCGWGHL